MRIGKLAEQAKLSRDTIRFYERNGLVLSTSGESKSNSYRDYPAENIERLAMIKEAQNAGFSIADLAVFFNQNANNELNDFDLEAFLQDKIASVENSISRSQQFLKILKTTKNALSNHG